ncbi:hypothetical protein EJB05_42487, partial [Eragrostis curvula]
MELGIEAARWVVSKALGPASGGVLEAWAASSELGNNIRELRMELLYAQGMLNNARGRGRAQEIQNPALTELLQELRDLGYRADDVMDELEYFRIQDQLDGTYHAADEHDGGCLYNHALNARHTTRAVVKKLGFSRGAQTSHDKRPSEDDTSGVSCTGALACLGPKTSGDDEEEEAGRGVPRCGALWPCGKKASAAPHLGGGADVDDDKEKEEEASREVQRCGAVWPCGKASAAPSVLQTNQGDKEAAGHGCITSLASSARGTIHAVGKLLPCHSVSAVQKDANSNIIAPSSGRAFLCCGGRRPNKATQRKRVVQAPKLKFSRVEMSQTMKEITDQLKAVCAKVSTILNLELLDSNRSIAQSISMALDAKFSNKSWQAPLHKNAMSRPMTDSDFVEPQFQGRDHEEREIIDVITKGINSDKNLTVLPIVGPGGLGKTTLTQKIYNSEELKSLFDVKLWVCVSINFSVYRLTQEIADKLRTNESKDTSPHKLIAEKLNNKRFLLVLDDMWNCTNEDDWERFLAPFKNGQTKGGVILVTTRIPQLARMVKTTTKQIDLEGLGPKAFEQLFLACIYGNKQPPNDHRRLLEIGSKIKEKLKGSPLAAKTVGRLLKKHIDLDHWTRVLESKEWESQDDENDIMPALKLSFEYLPFHLQQCFIYCAMFPEDYKFGKEELIHLWIGFDVLHSPNENKSIEDIGDSHLKELVDHGFLKKENDGQGRTSYTIHDLLHNLALKVSAQECLNICSSNVTSVEIPPSLRHLSIQIDDSSVNDRKTFDSCKEDFSVFEKRLKAENLRSLLLFGSYQCSFASTIGRLLRNAKAIRVIFSQNASHNMEHLLQKDSNHVHLRYLRTSDNVFGSGLFNNITRYYHLRVLDVLGKYGSYDVPRDMSNLIKLRHFVVRYKFNDEKKAADAMHSGISEVGKLKCLQALNNFMVKKETQGFELSQIGHLLELRGSLCITNLDKVDSREEAEEAKLMRKKHLHTLILDWGIDRPSKDPAREEQILEGLKPNSNLSKLHIIGHGGTTCPSWLGLYLKDLKSIGIQNVDWETFPPIGKFLLANEKFSSDDMSNKIFHRLGKIELVKLGGVKKWVVDSTCQFYSCLEVLIIKECSELMELSFSNSSCCQQEKNIWFPKLQKLEIELCPKLSSLPPVPWTCAPCQIDIHNVGWGFQGLHYRRYDNSGSSLMVTGREVTQDSDKFWMALKFDNLTKVKRLEIDCCPPLPLDRLEILSSLKHLYISHMNAIWLVEEERRVEFELLVEHISIVMCGATAKEINHILFYMPKLLSVYVSDCEKITGLGVVKEQTKVTSSSNGVDGLSSATSSSRNSMEEEEIAQEGLLLLPPQLQKLFIHRCSELSLRPDDSADGLQGLRSLRSLRITACPKFLPPSSASFSSRCPFPTSLQELVLSATDSVEVVSLSNLASLTVLEIGRGGNLRGFWCHLPRGSLTRLTVTNTRNFFLVDPEPSSQLQQDHGGLSSPFSVLQWVWTDDAAGLLAPPLCSLLSSSLTSLILHGNKEIERFTNEQEEALQLLTSLQELSLSFLEKLRCLPAGLRGLPRLRTLQIICCPAIRSLPTGGLPDSLHTLSIKGCGAIRSLPKGCLPNSLQELEISRCEAIRTLPKDGLPSSLRRLYVRYFDNEELKRHCRKLIGTIPIVECRIISPCVCMVVHRPSMNISAYAFHLVHKIDTLLAASGRGRYVGKIDALFWQHSAIQKPTWETNAQKMQLHLFQALMNGLFLESKVLQVISARTDATKGVREHELPVAPSRQAAPRHLSSSSQPTPDHPQDLQATDGLGKSARASASAVAWAKTLQGRSGRVEGRPPPHERLEPDEIYIVEAEQPVLLLHPHPY